MIEQIDHVAIGVKDLDDVASEHKRLIGLGLSPQRGPLRLEAAKADTALLRDSSGLEVQIICYDADSPDL